MNKDNLLISIIVPMHNAENYIGQTLASILLEKETRIEVIVVNDKSTDRSLQQVLKLRDDRVRVIEGPGRGISACMNTGLANARGSIIMRCDADDLYPQSRILHQVRWLEGHPEYDGVCGAFSMIDRQGNLVTNLPWTHLCTYAIRSSLIRKVGGFREYFETSEDLDFQLRLDEMGRIAQLPENWYFYRLHGSSVTHIQHSVTREFFQRTAYSFQKQRRTFGRDDLQRGCPPPKPDLGSSKVRSAVEHIQEVLLAKAWDEHRIGKKARALRTGIRALAANPLKVKVWKSTLALALRSSPDVSS